MSDNKTPRIYVACLAAYNAGRLHGAWINCNQDAKDIWAEIEKMLAQSPEPDAEEWAIHDCEHWQGIRINEIEDIERLASLAKTLAEHGAAFAAYCRYHGSDASLEDFQEHYRGQYKSEEDFAYEYWEELGLIQKLKEFNILDSYINWEAVARDLFVNSYLSVEMSYQNVYVFQRH
ncbi:antirestriction protein ArdA [Calothrix sp. FACHB-156]|nr:antirestriction protein ArdA [Calothrix sp. FACHB-156]